QVVQNTGADLGGGLFAYNAITWVNMQGGQGNEGFSATFQAIYFNAATILNGISFNSGDIAFSYGSISNFDIPAEILIGLDEGTGGLATLPGYESTNGWASHAYYGDLPVGPDEYVRFRADGNGYDVTIQPVPEPSAIMMFFGCSLFFLTRRRR
ncbi:MAG: PEP-CTERM sorting domain-containing protein, partial [Verrucomicrobiaceae bacterium]